eukprot:1197388-Prymnesium_polylepis.1
MLERERVSTNLKVTLTGRVVGGDQRAAYPVSSQRQSHARAGHICPLPVHAARWARNTPRFAGPHVWLSDCNVCIVTIRRTACVAFGL